MNNDPRKKPKFRQKPRNIIKKIISTTYCKFFMLVTLKILVTFYIIMHKLPKKYLKRDFFQIIAEFVKTNKFLNLKVVGM